jgi:transposase
MRRIVLTKEQAIALESQHRVERDRRVADRIKAVLLHNEGWTQEQISQALRIRPETVGDHLRDYEAEKLKPQNGGSLGHLNEIQTMQLIVHLEDATYMRVADICRYVEKHYDVRFTISGMTGWLHRHGFSYKQPKGIPRKADPVKQQEFIAKYEDLLNKTPHDEPVLFGDGVHPTMATKISYGWIRRGVDKLIPTTASRTRVNLFGALNLQTMDLITASYPTIDSEYMSLYFKKLRDYYPTAKTIHLILDQGPYNISNITKKAAEKYSITLHYLPTYSPNLNPIERCWKVMNEYVRNNRYFEDADQFRNAIANFFAVTWPQIAHSLVDRINDNFQTLNKTSSC